MSTHVPMECNNSKRVYKVGGNNSNMLTGIGGESSSVETNNNSNNNNNVNSNNTSNNNNNNNNNDKNSAKKLRRAFSITRNPFRWSRKYKTNNDDCSIKNNDKTKKLNEDESNNVISREGTTDNNNSNVQLQHNNNQKNNIKTSTNNKVLRRSSFRKFLSRIAQHVTSVSIGVNKHSSLTSTNVSDRVPPIGGYQWPPDQTPGVTGLKNHGNTCFMNAVLQCLSHTDILAEYFVLDQYKADLKRRNKLNSRKFGTKGELTEQLANVLKALWTCKNESDHSTSFKAVVDRYGSQFQSSTQHDAQEFLFWLLDKVHEDLNTATKKRYKTIKNSYGRPDEVIAAETLANHIRCNNSFVQAVFQAQFRSSLTCPRCHKQSNTFDPFHCISVQLPQLSQQTIFVTVLYVIQHPRQVKLGLTVPPGSPIIALREQLNADTGIPSNRMVLADINENGFSRVFYDSQPISTLDGINSIYCIEIPEMNDESSSSELMLLIANVRKLDNGTVCRFGTPFCVQVNRDCSYVELQKKLLKEMSAVLKPEVFAYTTPLTDMFEIRLQDPSADPDTYLEQVEHPLLTEIIDMALSVLSSDAGPPHIKLLLEWENPEKFFLDLSDPIVEHESVSLLKDSTAKHAPLTLEQCLEHYTKAETLSAEDAWRCPNCQQYLPVVKTLGLWSLPDILVIHFKRFRQQNEKGPDAAKLTTMVKFPLNAFDMSPHLARGSTSNDSLNNVDSGGNGGVRHLGGSPWRRPRDYNKQKEKEKELKDNRYDLYAVCYHQGETLETGHYTAACKNPYDHQWYKFDDQRVTHVPANQVQDQIVNNEAYILFYQRRKIDNLECSGTSSTSGDHWVSRIAAPPLTPLVNSKLANNNGQQNNDGSLSVPQAKAIVNTHEKCEKIIDENIDEHKKRKESVNECNEKHLKTQQHFTDAVFIEKTDENDVVDVEGVEDDVIDNKEINVVTINNMNNAEKIKSASSTPNKVVQNANESLLSSNLALIKDKSKDDNIPITNNYHHHSYHHHHHKQHSNHYHHHHQQQKMNSAVRLKDDEKNVQQELGKNDNEMNVTSLTETWSNKKIINDNDNNKINEFTRNYSVTTAPITATIQRNDKNNYCDVMYSDCIDSNTDVMNDDIVPITSNKIRNDHEDNEILLQSSSLTSSSSSSSSSTGQHNNSMKLRHSFSTNSSYKLRDTCDTLSMLRNTSNSCSKDTLIYIDQQNHHHSLIEEDDSFLDGRSIWISPVTPHKLITVSPKN